MIAVLMILGVAALVTGAELLVRGSARIATRFGISPLVIGLTVVAFGTSSPELAVSAAAALGGEPDIALGNVIGSNIFNILVVLGLSAIVAPIIVAREVVREQTPIMIGVSVLMLLLALNGVIGRGEGVMLFVGILIYLFVLVRRSRGETQASRMTEPMLATGLDPDELEAAARGEHPSLWGSLVTGLVGLGMLVLGSNLLVKGATAIAILFGMSELVIGLTIVSAGTSLPEVATSVVAAIRGERDMAVGNIIGSNIFNTLAILGAAAALAPAGIPIPPAALSFDLPVMIAVALVCLPIFFNGQVILRWEGLVLVGFYLAYTVYLVLDETGHHAFTEYRAAMFYFVLPLTAVTLIASMVRGRRRQVRARPGGAGGPGRDR